MRKLLKIIALVLAAWLASPVLAQQTRIAATLVPERAVAAPGETIMLAIAMKPDAGWHGYWENGGDAGFGMTLRWDSARGGTVGALRYPVPETLLINGLMNHVYEHDYALLMPFKLPATARAGDTVPIAAQAEWLACTDEICVPERGRLATTVQIGPPASRDPRFDNWLARLPAPLPDGSRFAIDARRVRLAVPIPAELELGRPHFFMRTGQTIDYAAEQSFARRGNLLLIDLKRAALPAGGPLASVDGVLRFGNGDGLDIRARPGGVPAGGEPLAGASPGETDTLGFLAILGAALLGGLILNVMPCVFPILSLKALSLARAGETPQKARSEGLAYTAGVILACLALGAAMLGLRAAGEEVGWAFQLQEPLVVAALLLLAAGITANLAGVYELPALGRGGGERGAFATGLLAAFVATPCTGPFMAVAMGAALVLPPALALAVFAALGLGLALPFLALGFIPALRRALPRPGPWMAGFRKAMAVPMGATALALLWLAWRVGGAGFAMASAGAALALVALLAAGGARQRRGASAVALVAVGVATVVAIAAFTLPRLIAPPGASGGGVLPATAFSQDALARARASGKPVFAYFTADWCLTCKVNEAAAIERETTRAAFAASGVTVLRGDWTRRDPAITRFLAEHGSAGVPLYIWYAPRAAAKVLPQVLTPAMLEGCAKGDTCG